MTSASEVQRNHSITSAIIGGMSMTQACRALPQLKLLSHSQFPKTKKIRMTSLVGAA